MAAASIGDAFRMGAGFADADSTFASSGCLIVAEAGSTPPTIASGSSHS